ncbi:MAG: GGDEF domain-containing protein [Pseudomonadota bacterium]
MPPSAIRPAVSGFQLALRLCLTCCLLLCASARAGEERKVLLLYSLGNDSASTWQALLHKGLYEELVKKTWGDTPSIFEERLDGQRIDEQAALDSMAPYLRAKYANIKFDAILTENYLAAGFLQTHPELFRGVPRYYVNHGRGDWHPADGKALEVKGDFGRAIGVIPLVAPGVKRIVVVGEQSARAQGWIAGVRKAAEAHQNSIAFEYWDNQSFAELYRRAGTLGPDSALFMLGIRGDSEGASVLPADVARKLAAVSPVPVFTHAESLVVPGITGGYVVSAERIGRVIAHILQGQQDDMADVQRYVFDYPSAERFHLRHLPRDTVWLNRPQGVWELYRWQILSGVGLIVLESVLITALVAALRSRRRTLTALHDERKHLEDRVLQRTLELLMANTKLEQLATTDPLTGIANRRKMTEQIARELERARRFRHPLALLMVDIDHFKRINDSYGHEVGDRAIIAVAGTLAASMRSIDLVARFGGEEFVLLMPETDIDVATGAAERLRETIAQLAIEIGDGRCVALTISIGVAAANQQDAPDTPSALLVRADKALYRAKQEGRDRVVMAQA